jgi:uncharacterized protein (DUF1330 family)
MTAYVVVELTVKDAAAKDRYSAAAGPIVKSFGGEYLANGPWTLLAGEAAYANGVLASFPDRETALRWYNSPEYQATFADRDQGLDVRFRLLG